MERVKSANLFKELATTWLLWRVVRVGRKLLGQIGGLDALRLHLVRAYDRLATRRSLLRALNAGTAINFFRNRNTITFNKYSLTFFLTLFTYLPTSSTCKQILNNFFLQKKISKFNIFE